MKKLFIIVSALFFTVSVWAQSPEKISYQAVIRNSDNTLVANTNIGVQISILQNSANGTPVYAETHTPNTNANGLVSIEIGTGTIVSGNFSTIDWATGIYFIQTETDITGGANYTITGTSQLLSVPYALHSKNTDSWRAEPNSTYTEKRIAHIRPSRSDAILMLEADLDNSNEELNPRIEFVHDGGYPVSAIGQNLLENGIENGMYISNNTSARGGIFFVTGENPTGFEGWQGLDDSNIRMTITTSGKIGINTASPERSLHVNDVLRLEPRSTPPSNPSKGDMYFDDTNNKLRVYDGTTWQNCW